MPPFPLLPDPGEEAGLARVLKEWGGWHVGVFGRPGRANFNANCPEGLGLPAPTIR